LSVGHREYFEEIAAQTAGVFKEKGVKSMVTISPHCYDVFKNHYPEIAPDFRVQHYTQFLAHLLAEGDLELQGVLDLQVTFQDPCYLGRINQEYAAPRQILGSIPGMQLHEMAHSAEDGLCCGGGGGRMWLETPAQERFSDLRVQQAEQCGAELLVTACPFCVTCLEDSIKSQPSCQLRVLDIAELAALAL
jgi:Fe-S oxidoreductase